MKFDWRFWAEFIRSVAWPGLAALTLLIFRKQIAEVLTQAARRLRRAPTQEVSVDLTPLPELASSWSVGSTDVRVLTSPQVFNGNSQPLFQELLNTSQADYAVVDLGTGREWLTSRLFLFALILGMVRNLRALVFVESSNGVRRRFLATASPSDVYKALALRYPWLEGAWLQASAAQYPQESPEGNGLLHFSHQHPLFSGADWEMVNRFARDFLQRIQRTTLPPEEDRELYMGAGKQPAIWEKTQWMDGERLERDLKGCLQYAWCEDSPDKPPKAVVNAVARRHAPLVALVDSDRRFLSLVDRYVILDRVKLATVKD